jgi:hypothetical protein
VKQRRAEGARSRDGKGNQMEQEDHVTYRVHTAVYDCGEAGSHLALSCTKQRSSWMSQNGFSGRIRTSFSKLEV